MTRLSPIQSCQTIMTCTSHHVSLAAVQTWRRWRAKHAAVADALDGRGCQSRHASDAVRQCELLRREGISFREESEIQLDMGPSEFGHILFDSRGEGWQKRSVNWLNTMKEYVIDWWVVWVVRNLFGALEALDSCNHSQMIIYIANKKYQFYYILSSKISHLLIH